MTTTRSARKSTYFWFVSLFLAVVICVIIPLALLASLFFQEDLFKTHENKNAAPVAAFVVAPKRGESGTEFRFDAEKSDDREDGKENLQFRWNFEDDGNFGKWSTEKNVVHKYLIPGSHGITLEVKDSSGQIASRSEHIEVIADKNTPPIAVLGKPRKNPSKSRDPRKNLEFEFDASSSKDEEDAQEKLKVRWDFNGDGNWDTPYSVEKKIIHTFDTWGTYTVVLEVADSKGAVDTKRLTISSKSKKISRRKHVNIDKKTVNCTGNCHSDVPHDIVGDVVSDCQQCHKWAKR